MAIDIEAKHATCELLGIELTGRDSEAQKEAEKLLAALDGYWEAFAMPEDGECIKCGTPLGGLKGAMLGGFQWGIVHGEGKCGTCGWPCRAIHRPKDAEGEDVFDRGLDIILPYHPAYVSKGPTEGESDALDN